MSIKEFEATLTNETCIINCTIKSQVTFRKLYGPLHFNDIRITLDFNNCEWVIERNNHEYTSDGEFISETWTEVARVKGQ